MYVCMYACVCHYKQLFFIFPCTVTLLKSRHSNCVRSVAMRTSPSFFLSSCSAPPSEPHHHTNYLICLINSFSLTWNGISAACFSQSVTFCGWSLETRRVLGAQTCCALVLILFGGRIWSGPAAWLMGKQGSLCSVFKLHSVSGTIWMLFLLICLFNWCALASEWARRTLKARVITSIQQIKGCGMWKDEQGKWSWPG